MFDEEFIEHCVQRSRNEVPEAVAIFLVGSLVRGDAGPYSDVDLDVLVPDPHDEPGPTWLDTVDNRPVCVSVWVRDVAEWLASENEAQDWAYGLPCDEPMRLHWVADDSWRARLDRSRIVHPAGEPELEHVLDALAKVANARSRGDDLGVRVGAQDLAREVPALLLPVNPTPPVASRQSALVAALDYEKVPSGYRDDMMVCLGLTGRPAGAPEVHAAAGRVVIGLVGLMAAHAETFSELLPPRLFAHLVDGRLRGYVAHLAALVD